MIFTGQIRSIRGYICSVYQKSWCWISYSAVIRSINLGGKDHGLCSSEGESISALAIAKSIWDVPWKKLGEEEKWRCWNKKLNCQQAFSWKHFHVGWYLKIGSENNKKVVINEARLLLLRSKDNPRQNIYIHLGFNLGEMSEYQKGIRRQD